MKQSNTKQQIFVAAAELFAQRGYMEVSIRDIARKVNIKGASIYYHYPSKEDILNDILDFYNERIDHYMRELFQVDLDAIPVEEYPLKMHFEYEPEDMLLMFWAGQIVMNEHFKNPKAAESLLGSRFEEYTSSYENFLNSVATKLGLDGSDSRKFAELLTRVSIVFMMQFQHTDMFDAKEVSHQMDETYKFVFAQFLKQHAIE